MVRAHHMKPYLLFFPFAIAACNPCTNSGKLKDYAHAEIKAKLRSPTTAEFSDEKVFKALDGSPVMIVDGRVTAQNGFGAPITEDYSFTIACKNGKPVTAYASMGKGSWGYEYDALRSKLDSVTNAAQTKIDANNRAIDSLTNELYK